jgi:hypothetical protein
MSGIVTPVLNSAASAATSQASVAPEATQKLGASKFDQVLASKSAAPQAARAPEAVTQAQQVSRASEAGKVRSVKIDWARVEKGVEPVQAKAASSKALDAVQHFLGEVERGQASMDKIIQTSLSSKKMNQQQLLGMQAMVYRYSQELELTSKVVEKATGGLKDTLKTQV